MAGPSKAAPEPNPMQVDAPASIGTLVCGVAVFEPTRNRVRTLPRVDDSLVAQTRRHLEGLMIDCGAMDASADVVGKSPRATDFPVGYFAQENAGARVSRNRGLTARGVHRRHPASEAAWPSG